MSAWRGVVLVGSGLAGAAAAHAAVNVGYLRRPSAPPSGVGGRDGPTREVVSILVPARDEARHVGTTVRSLLGQVALGEFELIVLDDGSTDGTADILAGIRDERLHVVSGPDVDPPPGWLGKPWACHRLARLARGTVLVFADADVEFAADAVAAAVSELRAGGFGLVAPHPRQVADSWLERLVQPLLSWSWLTAMPLRWAERSSRPSLAAANGQFLVVDAGAYWLSGGHAAVRGRVIEDIALARAVKRSGSPTATLDGSQIARCRMYHDAGEVVDGYAKSLWSAFGGPAGSAAVVAILGVVFVVPAIAVVVGPSRSIRAIGLAGYTAGVASRVVAGRRTADRVWPDALGHPAGITAFAVLNAISWERHLRGRTSWKGRATSPRPATAPA